ncbi:MAG: neutral zinc metallopeptidase [Rhodothermales bacterium]
MRWKSGRRSSNVEDRRGSRAPMGRGLKIGGGTAIIALLLSLLLGQDPTGILQQMSEGQSASVPTQANAAQDEAADFVSVVLADTEDTWNGLFRAAGSQYIKPTLVLFSDAVNSACGYNTAATGPFYCPGDQKVYLDLSFLSELQRFGAHGDFAVAYVIAHEVGHHIQRITGTEQRVRQAQRSAGQREANKLSVAMELQADCYAGVWAHHAHKQRQILEQGDVEEGLNAAASVGDDHMQKMAGQRVQPDAFTHGSSEQRAYWFRRGLESGQTDKCDAFSA